jgi:hypothetical protein
MVTVTHFGLTNTSGAYRKFCAKTETPSVWGLLSTDFAENCWPVWVNTDMRINKQIPKSKF